MIKTTTIKLLKHTADLFARCVAVLKPPPELTLSQWSDKYRRLSMENSAKPGPWRTDKAPYQREIMDAIGDPHNSKTVIMSAGQIGKTAMIMNMLLYQRLRHQKRGPNYCHFPLNEEAGYTEEYFEGLTSERQVIRWRKGRQVIVWEIKDSQHKRNEPLDLRNYNTAALEIANPVLQLPEETAEQKKAQRRRTRRRITGGIS